MNYPEVVAARDGLVQNLLPDASTDDIDLTEPIGPLDGPRGMITTVNIRIRSPYYVTDRLLRYALPRQVDEREILASWTYRIMRFLGLAQAFFWVDLNWPMMDNDMQDPADDRRTRSF